MATAIVVALAGVIVVGRLGRTNLPPTVPPQTSSPTGLGVAPRILEGVQAIASHTAPAGKDAGGNVVTYLASNVIDGDVQTAWRTSGDGHGETITLLFEGPVDIVKVGLIPGYAKTDPLTGVNRFEQDRIISKVRYLIPGLAPTVQELRAVPEPQFIHLSAIANRIKVEILDTTKPGGTGFNFTAISEIYVYGYPQ